MTMYVFDCFCAYNIPHLRQLIRLRMVHAKQCVFKVTFIALWCLMSVKCDISRGIEVSDQNCFLLPQASINPTLGL